MKKMDLDYLVIAVLFLSGLYVAATGLLMGLFGTPQFFWHSYAGYLSGTVAAIHLALKWSRVTAYLRRRLKRALPLFGHPGNGNLRDQLLNPLANLRPHLLGINRLERLLQ